MATCDKCGTEKPDDAFYRSRKNRCVECVKAEVRSNRSERIAYYQAYDRQRASDPDRVAARVAHQRNNPRPRPEPDAVKRAARVELGNAVRDGKVVRPPLCDVCSQPADPIHGHHDDYSKPLDVIWCCTACHSSIHAYWRAQKRVAA
jgi:hypothetical protein